MAQTLYICLRVAHGTALYLVCCSLPRSSQRHSSISTPLFLFIGGIVFRLPMPHNVLLDSQTVPIPASQLPYPAVKLVITRA